MPTTAMPSAHAKNRPVVSINLAEFSAPLTPDDTALAEAAQRGDLSSFGHLFQRHFPRVYDFVSRVARNPGAADEVTFQIFDDVISNLANSEQPPQVTLDLYQTAFHLASARVLASNGDVPREGSDYPSLIWNGTALLGPKAYAVVDMSVRQGFASEEIASVMGIRKDIAAQTVKRTIERAEQALAIFALVKTRVSVCPGMRSVVGAHAKSSVGTDLADLVAAHVERCNGCHEAWVQSPSPIDVLRRLPMATPAPGTQDQVWARLRRRFRWSGPGSRTRKIRAGSIAAALVVLMGIVGIVVAGNEAAEADVAVAPSVAPQRQVIPPVAPVEAVPTSTTTQPTTTTTVGQIAAAQPSTTSSTLPPSELPVVSIVAPTDGQRFASPSTLALVRLVAIVEDDLDNDLTVIWREGPTYLGSGNDVSVALAVGCPEALTHTVSATVTDSSGGKSSTSVTFSLRC